MKSGPTASLPTLLTEIFERLISRRHITTVKPLFFEFIPAFNVHIDCDTIPSGFCNKVLADKTRTMGRRYSEKFDDISYVQQFWHTTSVWHICERMDRLLRAWSCMVTVSSVPLVPCIINLWVNALLKPVPSLLRQRANEIISLQTANFVNRGLSRLSAPSQNKWIMPLSVLGLHVRCIR